MHKTNKPYHKTTKQYKTQQTITHHNVQQQQRRRTQLCEAAHRRGRRDLQHAARGQGPGRIIIMTSITSITNITTEAMLM